MTVTTLLEHPDLWLAGRPGRGAGSSGHSEPSGFPQLDRHLPGGGWPIGAVSELCLAQTGIGELQLLAPALTRLSHKPRWILWLNPPFLPYAPAMAAMGMEVSRMLLVQASPPAAAPTASPKESAGRTPDVHNKRSYQSKGPHDRSTLPDTRSRMTSRRYGAANLDPEQLAHQRTLWTLEQASRSGACSMVLAWLDERRLTLRDIQRLQLAARQGSTLVTLFRPLAALQKPSLSALRLQLASSPLALSAGQRLQIDIVKRRGGWPLTGLSIDIQPGTATRAEVMAQLEFWRSERAMNLADNDVSRALVTGQPRPSRVAH